MVWSLWFVVWSLEFAERPHPTCGHLLPVGEGKHGVEFEVYGGMLQWQRPRDATEVHRLAVKHDWRRVKQTIGGFAI